MTVASLELCKELYELSGWTDTSKWLYETETSKDLIEWEMAKAFDESVPAYDLGYLLRKLPNVITDDSEVIRHFTLRTIKKENEKLFWKAAYGKLHNKRADTPEDAACKLAIELFKQGVMELEL